MTTRIARIHFTPRQLLNSCRDMLVCLGIIAGLAAVANCESGCAAFGQGPTTTEQSYTTEIVACAATAGYPGAYDRASDMRCRDQVNCRYGLPSCPDGGK